MLGRGIDIWNSGDVTRNMVSITCFVLSMYIGTFLTNHPFLGPIVRFGPNSLSFNSNTALKTIYGHQPKVRKSQFYSVFPPTKDTFNTHSSISKASHARKRRVLSHAFSKNAIESMEKYVLANVRSFCQFDGKMRTRNNTRSEWGGPFNMADWCNYLTFDVMGDLCFGKAFEMIERPENRHVIDLIGSAAHMHLIVSVQHHHHFTYTNKTAWNESHDEDPRSK